MRTLNSPEYAMRTVAINRQPVELFKILKFEGLVATGGEAKLVIAAGQVSVNGEVETRKRRKIVDGDIVVFADETLQIHLA
jgi:ribosome-associated protein